MNTGTDERASTVETYISVSATPGEDAGVCVVCEDECTCGAAAAAASKATMTLSTTKKRLILKMPRPQNQPDNEAGGDHVRRIQSASFSPPGPHFDLPRIVPQKKGPPFKTELHLRQAAAHAARPVLPSNGRRNGTGPNDKFNGITLPSTILAAHDLPLNLSPAGLPTFIPASVFGSDSSLSSPSSESDDTSSSSSDDSLENGDTDSEIEAEEERLIVQETLAMQKLRARREQLDNARLETSTDENGRRRWDKMHWSNRERHGSVGPGNMLSDSDASGSRSSDSGSSGDDEHDDDDGEDDDAELHASSASGFGWSDYDDNFDADIFFANLSDSSFDSSDSDSDPEPEQSHPLTAPTARSSDGGVPLRGVIGASLLSYSDIYSSAPLPLVVTENWDGQLVFANGMKDGEEMMDVIFGTAALENDALLTTQAGSIHGTDEQETQDVDSDDRDDDYEKLDEPDDGETTDEDELHPELGPILFANSPFSESSNLHPAHNHRSTLSNVNHRVLQTRRHKNPSTKGVSSRLTPALSTSSGSQTFEPSKLIPSIGSFTISGDLGLGTSSAIIDGSRSEILPSPYSRPKHRKRRAVKQVRTSLHNYSHCHSVFAIRMGLLHILSFLRRVVRLPGVLNGLGMILSLSRRRLSHRCNHPPHLYLVRKLEGVRPNHPRQMMRTLYHKGLPLRLISAMCCT